jgi:potassium-transporting ATPase KdpC subunit
MKRDIVTAVLSVIVFTILLGLVYPLVITGVSQVAFPGAANGSQVKVNGKVVGSKLIGQSFGTPVLEKDGKVKEVKGAVVTEPDPRYFQTRPSATEGGADNAAASTFSNKGPNSVKTKEADEENIKSYLELNKPYDPSLTVAKIPVDAVNTSASGLDPEISPANARIQAHRVAALRRLPMATVGRLIVRYTHERGLGFSGEPGVNVLELNLALDRLTGKPA